MNNNRHINLDIDTLKHELQQETATPKAKDSLAVFAVLSSRIKNSFEDVPEEKRAEVSALVDAFLQENLKNTFSTIINAQCAAIPETIKILTKEVAYEVPLERTRELFNLSREIQIFILQQEIEYRNFSMQTVRKKIKLYNYCKEAQQYTISRCTEILQNKTIEKFDKTKLERALALDTEELKSIDKSLNSFLKTEEEEIAALEKTMMNQYILCAKEIILDLEKYALNRIVEKFRAHLSNDRLRPNVYFYLKELTENNGKYIQLDQIEALEKQGMNSPYVCLHRGRISEYLAEKTGLSKIEAMVECVKEANDSARHSLISGRRHFKNIITGKSAIFMVDLLYSAMKMMKEDLQEPEKTEMEEFLKVLVEFSSGLISIRNSSFKELDGIEDTLEIDHTLEKLSDTRVRNKFARFNDDFRKIQEKFPIGEIESGYEKAFYALKTHPRTKHETARQMHRNAMEAEEHLKRLRGVDEGTTRKDCDLRVAEYEKFARETEMPDSGYSGAIENITRESLEDGVTPREVKAMLSNMNMLHDIWTEELEDETKESERVELKKSLSETEEKIRILNQKLLSFADLSKEEAQKEECLRYAYLTKYKNECLKHIDVLKKEAEAEMVPLAREVMRKIEEIPNNPELSEKVEQMLEEIIEKEPHRLLTSKFIAENEYFWDEMPKMVDQLDKKIAETLGEASDEAVDEAVDEAANEAADEAANEAVDEAVDEAADEAVDEAADEAADEAVDEAANEAVDVRTGGNRKYHLTLQNSILALFFIFMILSLGLVCNSEFA
ncbi:uncharacterized protein NEMAJ01_1812 [Nematocida major]|uniref:uncharacterized protein n=1 Tax=Nematocida major TaxID=1912982 RepID=UPI002008642D|nr:uncharacterized protein NEMAJ01_1812 [Nematocida major]KAH9386916.1 hypothetical protein NEMAJ01_1812 [Nematocida major]